MPGPLSGLLVADFSRVSPVRWRRCISPILARRRQGRASRRRGRHPDPGVRPGPSTRPRTSRQCQPREGISVTWDLTDPGDLRQGPRTGAPGRRAGRELPDGTMVEARPGVCRCPRHNPGIIYASVTGFGSGAGASLPGYDFVAQAIGGLMSITGASGRRGAEGRRRARRRTDRQGCDDRHPGGVGHARSHRCRTAGRGQPAPACSAPWSTRPASYLTTGQSAGRWGMRTPHRAIRTHAVAPTGRSGGRVRQRRPVRPALLGRSARRTSAQDPRFATNAERVPTGPTDGPAGGAAAHRHRDALGGPLSLPRRGGRARSGTWPRAFARARSPR
jgi:hypothetical protein